MGGFKELKTLHKVIVDCMYNNHPIYAIKEMMIKKELMKNEDMKDEIWDRFLPQFKKQTVKRRKTLQEKKQKSKKKEYTPFPPEQLPRKEDLAMASGEYFLSEKEKKEEASKKKRDSKEDRKKEKIERQAKLFEAPAEDTPSKSKSSKA
jgi:ribosomal RNA assembly protein